MDGDRLSEVLDLIEVRSVVSGAFGVSGRWQGRTDIVDDLKFFALVRGRAWLTTDGAPAPFELRAGDVAVLNGRSWVELHGGDGEGTPTVIEPPSAESVLRLGAIVAEAEDIVVGGRVELNPTGKELLLRTLPAVAHIRSSTQAAPHLRGIVDRLFDELVADRVGSAFAVRQYCQLLLLDVLRAFMDGGEVPSGWLRLLADEQLRPALALLHAQPAKAWRLEDLARAAAMSRTTFAERFRDVAGTPPQSYLLSWRMLLARRELRSGDTRVRPLALQLGYSSESAFSTAFKREVGESPLRYRSRSRRESPQVGVRP